MSLRFINRPVFVPRKMYAEANEFLINYFKEIPSIVSIYQFGNITAPGISDIDLLLVFKDEEKCLLNGFEIFPERFNYLFTHGMMALCEKHFHQNHHYTLWSDYVFLHGKNIAADFVEKKTKEEIRALKIQTALEFLVANYIDLKVQLTYGIIKLRSFLQHMKGIIYDLEFLDVHEGKVYDQLIELRHWIKNWFKLKPTNQQITDWIKQFILSYELFVSDMFHHHQLYLPAMNNYYMARNATLKNQKNIGYKHSGIVLPKQLSIIGKKYSNLQNRFNRFEFYFPIVNDSPFPIVKKRFEFLKEMKTYNREYLLNFMTITTSITSKII